MTDSPAQRSDEGVWAGLRRRKLVQWGLAYAAGAWGLQQGLAYVSTLLGWPVQVQRLTGLALLIGLPIALVLAWYHGDRGQRQVTRSELAVLTLLFLLGGGVFWYFQRTNDTATVASTPPPSAPAFATDASIAVLPFVNMSADKEQEYFADGISEELLNLLAQVPELRVIARTSSFSFKGKDVDIAEIARRLNVANVLEGSVRKSGDKLRITAQLVRASDSSHLWSQTYDRQMTDVFKVQDEIAADVVAQLKIKLLGAAPKLRGTDPQAYALFLQGREVARQFNSATFEQAVALYKQALAIDANYAPAWDALADAYYGQIILGVLAVDQGLPLARAAIKQALVNDPTYAPAYGHMAIIEGNIAGDLAAAARHLEQGLALDPSNLDLIGGAVLIARRLDRLEQSTEFAEYAVARDPVSAAGYEALGYCYFIVGRLEEAAGAFRTGLKLSPEYGGLREMLGETLLRQGNPEAAVAEMHREPVEDYRLGGLSMAYHALGREADSSASLDELIRRSGHTMPYTVAYAMAFRGDIDRAFEWLEKAVQYRDAYLGTLASDPMMETLHSDPRWRPLLRRLGQAPEQLAAIKFDVKVPN